LSLAGHRGPGIGPAVDRPAFTLNSRRVHRTTHVTRWRGGRSCRTRCMLEIQWRWRDEAAVQARAWQPPTSTCLAACSALLCATAGCCMRRPNTSGNCCLSCHPCCGPLGSWGSSREAVSWWPRHALHGLPTGRYSCRRGRGWVTSGETSAPATPTQLRHWQAAAASHCRLPPLAPKCWPVPPPLPCPPCHSPHSPPP